MNKEITPQNLAQSAEIFAPLFKSLEKKEWDTLCKLIANILQNEYPNAELPRVFVLNSNTGVNSAEAMYMPVEAKNTEDGIKDKEAVSSRPELVMAQLQDKDDVLDKVSRGSGSYRVSSSTGKISFYGTAGILGEYGTTEYILKISLKPSK